MAQPIRAGRAPPRRKTPSGRFWTGKSVAGSFADSTQLRSAASWVPSVFGDHGEHPRASARSATGSANEQEPKDDAKSRRRSRSSSVEARRCRQERPSSSRRKAAASSSRSTRLEVGERRAVAGEGGRREHVQEAVQDRPRAARLVGEGLLGADRVVQPGGGLEGHAGGGAGGDEPGQVGGIGNGVRHDAAGAHLGPRAAAAQGRRAARRGRRRAAPRRKPSSPAGSASSAASASSGPAAFSSTASTTARPACDRLNDVTSDESP